MPVILTDRLCAEVDGEVVVFLIGMRINRPWKVWKWLPIVRAMLAIMKELTAEPAIGLLASRPLPGLRSPALLQYWRSAEHLRAYAHNADKSHFSSWQAFNRAVGANGDVGIWHETYVVAAGDAEAIYVNMPRFGLGRAGELFPAKGDRATAAKRLARR